MSIPDKKIVPFDASLGALLPAGKPDQQVSRLHYLRLAMPTSRFMSDTSSPIYASSPISATSSCRSATMNIKSIPATRAFCSWSR